ncbi:MAG TPA: non-homologous end-joining DNA ligase [Kofleriaceae bacterium]|nr:non-homologous end-joining DNA ligase [Kofleriaceae bacterium]
MEYRFGDLTIAATHVERVVFPDVSVTKGDVLAYYHDVAPVMLPELRDRALTLERFTKGLAGGGFYQKHWQKHFPAWIDRAELGGKTRVVYPICNSAAALVYFANQGALAFHVWTSRAARPLAPDLLVFDLDPPERGFELVRFAARAIHDVLGELALPTFVKTTGSKGLHVVVPLDGKDDFATVGELGHRIAAALCARHPDQLTTEFYKKDRKGRLFMDTMRNAPGATVVAAYSLRGRPNAPVSAPIEWSELDDPALRADGFTLRELRARLDRRGDPWRALRSREASARSALAALVSSAS